MQTIQLTVKEQIPCQGHTSKGDQPKWQKEGLWYKADHMGYEGLAEVIASRLLKTSSVSDFVAYEPVLIQTEDRTLRGCVSCNFRAPDETLVPLERMHRSLYGYGLAAALGKIDDAAQKIQYTVSFVEQTTGLQNFGRYLSTMLELDAFLLNEDRHTNNIAVIRNNVTKEYRFCPFFDNGLSLLSDLTDYPTQDNLFSCIKRVRAKPFCFDFLEQAEAASVLYGSGLSFTFRAADIPDLLSGFEDTYPPEILKRVEWVIREQSRKFGYLFQTPAVKKT